MIETLLVIASFVAGFFLGVKKRSTERITWQDFLKKVQP